MLLIIRYLFRWWRARQADPTAVRARPRPRALSAPARPTRATAPARPTRATAASRGSLALLAHQVRYDIITSLRNPRARFFTFFFPVLLLVVFSSVFGHGTTTVDGVTVKLSRYYVPGILAASIVVATYANLVVLITTLRETGVLKRRRATPVPPVTLIAGQALATVVVAVIMGTILLVLAKVAYGVGLAPGALAATACTAILGALAMACVGYLVSGFVNSPDAAQPIVQATMLPLWFISGVFIPDANLSSTLRGVAKVFPVEHLANGLHTASIHSSFGAAISATNLLVLAAWGVGAAALAAWRFSWLPSAATA
jgi:ABC-2 type transport system permease protein